MHQLVSHYQDLRKISIFCLIFIPSAVHSQSISWERVRIDGLVSVDLPQGWDPEGGSVAGKSMNLEMNVKTPNGSFLISKKQQYGIATRRLDDLSDFYKSYRDIYTDSAATVLGGTAISINGLRGYRFLYKKTDADGTRIGDVAVFLLKDMSYSFEFICDQAKQRTVNSLADHFFASISISYIEPAEQYTEYSSSRPVGEGFGKILRYGGMVFLLLLSFVLWILRTWSPLKIIRIVSACILILAGTTELVLSIINKAIQKNHQAFVFFGYLYLIAGIVLLFIKLPIKSDEE